MASDLLDGYVARKLDVATYFGKVLDLVADKSLTVIALLYAAERGIDLLPLAVIAMRDVVMIGMRLVTLEGKQLLPTNRVFGGVMASLIGASTLVLVNAQSVGMIKISNILYWVCALVFAINLLMRLHRSAPRIVLVSTGNLLSEAELDSCRKCRCKHE
jgi:phosphatidylglycerophosphate synthase